MRPGLPFVWDHAGFVRLRLSTRLLDAKPMELARARGHARENNAALGTFRLWACGYVPTTMIGTLRIRLPACSREALALPSKGLLEVTMRIDQLRIAS